MSLLLIYNSLNLQAGDNPVPAATPVGSPKSKKRYIIKVEDRLLSFADEQSAVAYLNAIRPVEEASTPPVEVEAPQEVVITPVIPEAKIDLAEVERLYKERQALNRFNQQLRNMQYEALLRVYEQWVDDEEIELLLMAG